MDAIDHYLKGGRDLGKAQEELRKFCDTHPPLPVPGRPLRHASDAELAFEREVRRGPRYRCSGCGWLYAGKWRAMVPDCPVCGNWRKVQPFTGMAQYFTMPGRERDWLLATAEWCGLDWGGEAKEGEDKCPHCGAGFRTHSKDLMGYEAWHCGSHRDGAKRSEICCVRQIEMLTERLAAAEEDRTDRTDRTNGSDEPEFHHEPDP